MIDNKDDERRRSAPPSQKTVAKRIGFTLCTVLLASAYAAEPMNDSDPELTGSPTPGQWWEEGDGRPMNEFVMYPNRHGSLGILNTAGAIETKGHPFFEPLGTNGRACVTCHQPADAMSVSVGTIRDRWEETQGK